MRIFFIGLPKTGRSRKVYITTDDSYRRFIRGVYRHMRSAGVTKMAARFYIFKLLEAGTTGKYEIR